MGEIERRKEHQEKLRELQDREAEKKRILIEEKEREEERRRQQEDQSRRLLERQKEEQKRQQLEKNRTILEDIKKRATEVNKPTWKVAGINVNDITDETLQALSPEQIVQAREDQLKRERQEKI